MAQSGERERTANELHCLPTQIVPDTVAWLEALGIVFFGPIPEPGVPSRLHNAPPNSRPYIYDLQREARRHGSESRPECAGAEVDHRHRPGRMAQCDGGCGRLSFT
jgi:hypothetical protein